MYTPSLKDIFIYGVFAPIENKKLRLGLTLATAAVMTATCVLSRPKLVFVPVAPKPEVK